MNAQHFSKNYRGTFSVTLMLATMLICGCNNPEGDFKKAERVNTEQAYQDFIKRHPDGPLAFQAQFAKYPTKGTEKHPLDQSSRSWRSDRGANCFGWCC